MSDLVERLRVCAFNMRQRHELVSPYSQAMNEAADEIERLRREVEVLRRYGNKICTAMADEELEKRDG